MGFILHNIVPLVINSLGGRHTHMHTDIYGQSNSKKPGMHQSVAGAPGLKIYYDLFVIEGSGTQNIYITRTCRISCY